MDKFYFWMYRGLRKIRKEDDPAADGMWGVLFFIIINIIIVGRFVHSHTNIVLPINDLRFIAFIMAFILIVPGYYGLYGRRKQIFYKMSLLSIEQLKRDKFIFISYIIISIIGFYVTLIYFWVCPAQLWFVSHEHPLKLYVIRYNAL